MRIAPPAVNHVAWPLVHLYSLDTHSFLPVLQFTELITNSPKCLFSLYYLQHHYINCPLYSIECSYHYQIIQVSDYI